MKAEGRIYCDKVLIAKLTDYSLVEAPLGVRDTGSMSLSPRLSFTEKLIHTLGFIQFLSI
jgi:hypothetical protein